jgi:hypothetical protein
VLVGLLGSRVIRRMSGRVTDLLVEELKRFWSETAPRADRTNAEGGEDV